jgi:integrase
VSERLGHATVSFTLDTYSHVMPGMQEEAASAVAELVLGS